MIKIIKNVFKHHKFEYIKKIEKIKGGFVSEVYLINNKYIIKFAGLGRGLKKENFVLKFLNDFPVPEVIVYDNTLKVVPYEYIIITKLEGQNLLRLWPNLDEYSKEDIFLKIIEIFKKFRLRKFNFYGDLLDKKKRYKEWSTFFEKHFEKSIKSAQSTGFLKEEDFIQIQEFYNSNKAVLGKNKIRPNYCHTDLHFSNILVKNNQISGILDFDLSQAAPFDFELEIPICFFKQPHFFIVGDLRKKYPTQLIKCLEWLKKYYKEFYDITNIKTRMILYSIAADMEMLWLCGKFGHGKDIIEGILSRLRKTLRGGYIF